MDPELARSGVTEVHVRMDCNGCVQKIKKALHGVQGIHDLYIDLSQQKVTVVGWADPERIIKAIKKARKTATICNHKEPTDPATEPTEPAQDAANPPPTEADTHKEPPPPEVAPSLVAIDIEAIQLVHPTGPNYIEDIPLVNRHSSNCKHVYDDYWNNHPNIHGHWNNHPNGHGFQPNSPVNISCSYEPSPYFFNFESQQSPRCTCYSQMEYYSEDYNDSCNSDGNNVTSMFSEENPNACGIV